MKVRIGYPDRVVVVENNLVYLFKEKLYSAPLEEVIAAAKGDGVVSPELRKIAPDIVEVLQSLGRTRTSKKPQGAYA